MLGTNKRLGQGIGVVLVGLSVLVAACSDDDKSAETGSTPADQVDEPSANQGGFSRAGDNSLPAGSSWAATARADVRELNVYPDPTSTEPSQTIPSPDAYGATAVFLVDGADVSGERIPVYLPVPPNGSTGWIDKAHVELVENPYAVTVELGAHRLTVANGTETIVDTEVGVGRNGRETPTGRYFITDLQEPPTPDGDYGRYIYIISGFPTQPEVLAEFGEDAVVGIHGTNQPELLGTDVSSGCIRMNNDVITEMATYIPLGTPVNIVA